VGAVFARAFVMPASWGAYGHYRGNSIAEERDHDVRHRGNASCRGCHAAQSEAHDEGRHATLACETCHAPYATHVSGGARNWRMPTLKTVDLCARCHRELDARPHDFPQVNFLEHVQGKGLAWSDTVCFSCHSPHSPFGPVTREATP
jgi:hypothetical protein